MHWALYNPQEDSLREGLPSEISRMLRKRNYLIEKAKNANIVGESLCLQRLIHLHPPNIEGPD